MADDRSPDRAVDGGHGEDPEHATDRERNGGNDRDGDSGDSSRDHDPVPGHGHGGSTSARTLGIVAAINLVGFVVEFAGGLAFGSVALLSDAVHMLFDVLAYAMAFAAAHVAARSERSDRWSYGLHRLEPASAFLNGALLIPMVGYILLESFRRFAEPTAIDAGATLPIAVGGLLINALSVYVLSGGGEMGLNERGAFYHLLGDTGGSVAVVVSTVVVATTGVTVVDPVVAVVLSVVVLWSAWRVLRGSAAVLLQGSPVPTGEVRATVAGVDGVEAVRDVHVWQVCSHITIASIRITESATSLSESHAIRARVHDALADLGVTHATVEPVDPDRGHRATLDAHSH